MFPWMQSLFFDVPILTVSILLSTAIVSLAILFFTNPNERKNIYILVFGLASLGAVAGVAGGSSRVGAVGDIVPAALTLAGGVSAYLFGVDRSKGLIASVCTAAFALALGFGYATSAGNRAVAELKTANVEFCLKLYSDPEIWNNDRAFCRVASILGEQCNWLIADSFAQVPETSKFKTKDVKFTYVFSQLENAQRKRMRDLTNCTPLGEE